MTEPAEIGSGAVPGERFGAPRAKGAPARAAGAEPRREMTGRAICVAVLVAALMGAAEPVVVLKIGYGPNMSVVSAFLGFIALSLIGLVTRIRGTRWETNLVQTAGTAAGSGVGSGAWVVVVYGPQPGAYHVVLGVDGP